MSAPTLAVSDDALAAAIAELIETQRETLRMLEAAHRQLGMCSTDNPRILRARRAIANANANANAGDA